MSIVRKDPDSGLAYTRELGTGLADGTTFLRGDGTWAPAASGGGTVTSVNANVPIASTGGTTPLLSLLYDNVTITLNGSSQLRRATLAGDVSSPAGSNTLTLATVNGSVGSFTNASITVNAKGLVTAASSGTAPVTSVSGTATRISSTGGTTPVIDLVNTAVTPGSYTYASLTVDAAGRLTAASNGATPALAARTITATSPIRIDGGASADLSANRTLSIQGSIVSGSTSTSPQNLGSLTTGLLKGTVSASVSTLSTAVAGTDYQAPVTWPSSTQVYFTSVSGTKPAGNAGLTFDDDVLLFTLGPGVQQLWQNASGANAEWVNGTWATNVWTLKSRKSGSGTVRAMTVDADTATLTLRGNSADVHGSSGVGIGLLAGVRSTPQVTIAGTTSVSITAGSGSTNPALSFAASQATFDTSVSITAGFPAGQLWDGVKVTGSATVPGTGTITAAFGSTTFAIPTITGTGVGATITDASTVLIKGGPSTSGITVNLKHALWVQADISRFDGDLMLPAVANGSVATVLGSLGPAGSHTTVQKWFKWMDNSGTPYYVPGF